MSVIRIHWFMGAPTAQRICGSHAFLSHCIYCYESWKRNKWVLQHIFQNCSSQVPFGSNCLLIYAYWTWTDSFLCTAYIQRVNSLLKPESPNGGIPNISMWYLMFLISYWPVSVHFSPNCSILAHNDKIILKQFIHIWMTEKKLEKLGYPWWHLPIVTAFCWVHICILVLWRLEIFAVSSCRLHSVPIFS